VRLPRKLLEVTRQEALRRLGSVAVGRIVFSQNALPAIRPVNHVVDGDAVVVRTHLGSATRSARGMVVAYEADVLDQEAQLGWSVVVTGVARQVTDPDDVARFEDVLTPWLATQPTHVIRIEPRIVSGYELVEIPAPRVNRIG
jgi:nitroimidazol reductase NimA-like FMN-containing flavoprotein (pyridoxamine 5'-phosphate oxidase superfamily)